MNIDCTAVAYAYNAQGIRTAKRVNNLRTSYLLDGGNVVAEVQNNTVTENYLRGVNLIRREATNETEYYLFNAHGDVVTTTNLNGTINQEYDYDAFGNEKNPDALDSNHFRYCGEYLDFETGDYYLRARYYAPTIGRFTQQDTHWNTANMIYGDNPQKINEREDKLGLKTYSYAPQITAVMQSGNLYVYAINNPVNYLDPSGNIALVDDFVVAGLVYLSVAAAYAATPLLTKMLQEMGKTFTDVCNMAANEIRSLIELAKSKYAESQAASQSATAVAAPAAAEPNDDNNKYKFKDESEFNKHYQKHKGEFGNISQEDYLQRANNLINSSDKNVLTKVRTNGDTVFYNTQTNEFAVVTKGGIIRTFFKPTAGINYFYG